MAFLGNDAHHTLSLLPQASGQTLERYALAGAGVAADPPVAVGVFVVVVRVEEHWGLVVEIQPQKDAVAVTVLIGHKGESCGYAGSQRIAAALALNVGVQCDQRQRGEKTLLVGVIAAAGDHVHRYTQLLHSGDALFQRIRIIRHHFDKGVHIVEVLPLPVHDVLQVETGGDGTVQLLIVLTGISHIPHPAAVEHGGLRDLGEDLFTVLAGKAEADIDPLARLHQRRKPAGADCGAVAIAGDVEVGMKNAVHYDVVTAFRINGGGGENVQNGGGAGFQLGEIRLFRAEQQPFQKRLLLDNRLGFCRWYGFLLLFHW